MMYRQRARRAAGTAPAGVRLCSGREMSRDPTSANDGVGAPPEPARTRSWLASTRAVDLHDNHRCEIVEVLREGSQGRG